MLDVSCIIINYNTSKYTYEAVVSLLDTHNNTIKFEIIVVDTYL
jgi:glycosyltransferase involved in cell wall biosynthesis